MKRTLLISLLLILLSGVACSDSSTDSDDRIGTPGPAIGISAGLDPTLVPGDDFGALAGAVVRPHGSPSITNSSPSSLSRLQMESSCNFWEGGMELGRNGASEFTAESAGATVQAAASNTFEVHDDNTRISIDFEVGAIAEPQVEAVNTNAEASVSGADPFGIIESGVIYVIDMDNLGGHEVDIEIGWNLNTILGGDPDEAQLDAILMMNMIRSCGEEVDMFPFEPHSEYLFYILDESVSTSGSQTIHLGRTVNAQILLSLEAAVNANAFGEIRGSEGQLLQPSVHSFGSVDGQIEINVISVRP
ncbi:MAG: hypothetical protein JJU13_18570 [Balneolaceae bacterium]|nr:hypothetical protein [Balneolaceae bacterium]